jgi:isopentenyl-diphosphate delta-isomerase
MGATNQNPTINKEEVESYKWMLISDIKKDIISNPNQYTSWFKIALEKVF